MEKVRIQDDLYTHVNQETLDNLVIPDDRPTAGGFASLDLEIRQLMLDEFIEMSRSGVYPDEHLERACTLFKAARNVKKKEKDGIRPAVKYLSVIDKLDTVRKMNNRLSELVLDGIPLPFSLSVSTDMKDTSRHCVFIQGPDVILPDASYYKPEMEQQKTALLGIWSNMAATVLEKAGFDEQKKAKYIEDTLAFDAMLGQYVKTREEWSEYVKMYNPMKVGRVCGMMKPLNMRKLMNELFGLVPETVIVTEPRYFKAFKEIFNEENFTLYRHWAFVTALVGSCSLLSEELREIGSTFFRTIAGIPKMTPVDTFAYELASGIYSEAVGVYYGEKYFGQEAKKDITSIVYQIIDMYKERIQNNDFLEESTREKAILKLSKIGVKMGYPDKVDPFYDKLIFNSKKSLFEIVRALGKIRLSHQFEKLSKPVDRGNWEMPGHMVNACYDPFVNDITFPAAILQPPFYSLKQTRSENLGGIGAVIGHEISHAFDSNGAKCDENGIINNWWTKEDNKKFNTKINAMVKQFDKIELPWGVVNGKFIVSENMADNGGMAVTLQLWKKRKTPLMRNISRIGQGYGA